MQLKMINQKHQSEIDSLKKDYEGRLEEIKAIHLKDKEFLEEINKRYEERHRRDNMDGHNIVELENRYLRDIKDLNDSFDDYKRQMERHVQSLLSDKLLLENDRDMLD